MTFHEPHEGLNARPVSVEPISLRRDGAARRADLARLVRLYNVAAAQFVSARRGVGGSDALVPAMAGEGAQAEPCRVSSIAIFLPAFNEAPNIASTVERTLGALSPLASDYKVIVVDDGSTDGTARIVTELAGDYPDQVIAVGHVRNRGYGAALRTGFQVGLQTGYEWIGFVDSDGQFDVGEVGLLLEAAHSQSAQFVAGYRVARADHWTRRQMGNAWDELTGRIVNHGLRDVDCGFKIVHRDILGAIELTGTYASISPELAAKARRAGTTIAEVGVTHYPRAGGRQTGANVKVVVRSLLGLIELRREISGHLR